MKDKWYQEGLKFSCQQCGNCCSGEPGYVWVSPKEIESIQGYLEENDIEHDPQYLRRVGRHFSLVERENGDCIFLRRSTNGLALCAINKVKPTQCRNWPFWDNLLISKEMWEEEAKDCPGMNQGKWYSFAEIEKMLEKDI